MLCAPSQQQPPLMHPSYDVGMASTSSKACNGAASVAAASSSAPSSSPTSTPPLSSSGISTRHRHHARSYSSDSQRFFDQSSSPSSSSTSPSSSSSSPSSQDGKRVSSMSVGILPVRSRKPSPPPRTEAVDGPPTQPTPHANGGSPPKKDVPSPLSKELESVSPSKTEQADAEQKLAHLRQAQQNRRPRMMRLTPAFSSLPGRSPPDFLSQALKTAPLDGLSMQEAQEQALNGEQIVTPPANGKVAFPTSEDTPPSDKSITTPLDSDPPTPVAPSATARKPIAFRINGHESSKMDAPEVNLHIDLACIPSPAAQDGVGPVSTSYIPDTVRDRNGNPIKPSLKGARSSVSHLFTRPGRSDSTPELPSTLRAKSVPTTPTLPKAVHFDAQLEHVKLFKNRQRPAAVSRDGSPEQTETETEEEKDFPYIWRRSQRSPVSPSSMATAQPYAFNPSNKGIHSRPPSAIAEDAEQLVLRLPNFPSSTRLSVDREVFLERIYLADDLRSVKGTVRVRNLSFEKWVAIRYTLDHWTTTGEVSAEHSESIQNGNADRFTFSIKLNELLNWPRGSPAHETKSMFLCIRYTVSSGEFWDNNEGKNYQLDFRKRLVPSTPLSTPNAAAVATAQNNSSINSQRAKVADAPSTSPGSAKSRVMEMAKKGVHGGTTKGGFAIEDLRRELDRLRSDEEEENSNTLTQVRTFASEMAKRKMSPPSSPGRSASPTPWTARYDFGASLKNPRSGSRTTGQGRAAALDYFSAKPTANPGSTQAASSQMIRGGASFSQAAKPTDASLDTAALVQPVISVEGTSPGRQQNDVVQPSPDFSHRFGMISPGLGESHVEHRPVSTSTGSSVEPSPDTTPSHSSLGVPRAHYGGGGGRSSSERFYSFPPNRHMQSPGSASPIATKMSAEMATDISPSAIPIDSPLFEDAVLAQARGSPLGSPIHSRKVPPSPATVSRRLSNVKASMESKADVGLIVEDYSPSASPVSPCGSPNPFSPSASISSNESDTTISTIVPDEPVQSKLRPRKAAGASKHSSDSSDGSSTPDAGRSYDAAVERRTGSGDSDENDDDDGSHARYRPASMSDYQELINRFCWNSDLVPSGGSTVLPTPPSHSPTNTFTPPMSGTTTPTLC